MNLATDLKLNRSASLRGERILFVHHGSSQGGAAISLCCLAGELQQKGLEVTIAGFPEALDYFAGQSLRTIECCLPMFKHTTLGSYNLMQHGGRKQLLEWHGIFHKAISKLADLLEKEKPDLVHFNSLTLAPYCRVPKQLGIPNVVHVREPVLNGYLGLRKYWLRQQLIRYADHVISICRDNLDRLHLTSGKGTVVYNPVDFRKFDWTLSQSSVRIELGIPIDAEVVLLTVSSTPAVKGFEPFLEAMRLAACERPDLWCLMPGFVPPAMPHPPLVSIKRRIAKMVGYYNKRGHLFRICHEGRLAGHIIGCSFTREMEKWIAAADVICIAHTKPHFSRTVMEAGAMKKPVVAFSVGGVVESVEDGGTGLLVPPGDVHAMAKAVLRLLDDHATCMSCGEKGYEIAHDRYDSVVSADAIIKVYEHCLG